MVLYSTQDSICQEEVSVAALLELLISVALVVVAYYFFDFVFQIAVGAILAPLLLLRTNESTDRVWRWAKLFLDYLVPFWSRSLEIAASVLKYSLPILCFQLLSALVIYPTIVVALFGIRVFGAVVSLVMSPIDMLASIPGNWRRVVLYTDFATLPELLPEIERYPESDSLAGLKFSSLNETFKSHWQIGFLLFIPFIILIFYVPAYFGRVLLKWTAVFWSPLIWFFRPVDEAGTPRAFATSVVNRGVYKFARGYSLLVGALLLLKGYVWISSAQLVSWLASNPFSKVLMAIIAPHEIILWQIASFVNVCLTWLIYFKASDILYHSASASSWSEPSQRNFFRIILTVQNLLSAYTTLCLVYIALQQFKGFNLPPIRILIFPWS